MPAFDRNWGTSPAPKPPPPPVVRGRTYPLSRLLTGGWSLSRIDQEVRDGKIEIVRGGGRTVFRLL